jgi:hypothetical protein
MRKNQDRKHAEKIFLEDRGRVTNKELARTLGIHPATIARWRKIDEWDIKLVQSVSEPAGSEALEEDFFATDLRHIQLLNERIDGYLGRKDLLPAEIRDLAEAKFQLMTCMELIHDHVSYPAVNEFEDLDEEI